MTSQATNGGPRLELLASTGNIASTSQRRKATADLDPFIESAQWTADGTVVLTSSSENQIAGYIVPEDLLAPKSAPSKLSPSCRIQLPERSNVLASAPYFSLSETYTHQVLVSSRDHPIQLYYLQPSSGAACSTPKDDGAGADDLSNEAETAGGAERSRNVYPAASSFPFIKPRSEIFETATSLIWPAPGHHFIAGTRNMLAKFDVSRSGSGPIMHVKTVSTESRGGGQGGASSFGSLRGTISTLSAQPSNGSGSGGEGTGLVAAGTWTRWVGLYDFASSGQCVATWGVASAATQTASQPAIADDNNGISTEARGIGGAGITQTIWSPCGRYLLINERRSMGILVYDIRVTGKLLGWLSGREARVNQRIMCDVYPSSSSNGFEVWSGTTQGAVKVWEDVGSREGAHSPAWDWQAHEATVGSACLHQSGSVVATASGSWEFSTLGSDVASSISSASSSSPGSGPSAESSGSSSDDEAWLRRTVRESSLKLWGIASSSDRDDDAFD
ncbi:hypothetical protein Micbo1qcDRAFT_230871 [Microdochium bolleyi]|uniref:WD40-repeat-containing domain protein n=1 Tax=Microdochium bolleyi TaxID=196109 RepID=A0A136JEU6_9PEZI|nr:hypothetical protein Micbo1qcDRAFT_230871 [Microdochium bolleyi]